MNTTQLLLFPDEHKIVDHMLDLAWCGGYISARGSFVIKTPNRSDNYKANPRVRFQIMSNWETTHADLERILRVTKLPVSVGRHDRRPSGKDLAGGTKAVLSTTGATLHDMMLQLWPYLNDYTRIRYNNLRKEAGQDMIP